MNFKRLIFFLVLSSSLLFSENISDVNVTGFDTGISSDYSNGIYDTEENFDEYNNTTEVVKDDNGVVDEVRGLDLSNSKSIEQYIDHIKSKASSGAMAITQDMASSKESLKDYATIQTDVNNASIDTIMSKTTDSKELSALQQSKDTVTTLLNYYGSKFSIKCYIKRSLVPSYFCPIPSMSESFFVGGAASSSNEKAQNDCNELCKEKRRCIGKSIDGFESTKIFNLNKTSPLSYELDVDSRQKVKDIDIVLQSSSDKKTYVLINLYGYIEDTQKELQIVKDLKIYTQEEIKKITLPINSVLYSKFRVTVSKPFSYSVSIKNYTLANSITINTITLNYYDDKYWFCPPEHFVTNASDCIGGKIKDITISGVPYLVCVKENSSIPTNEYGAYYGQYSCEAQCYYKKKCEPTYRHLLGISKEQMYNIDYGCVSDPNNQQCTKDKCKELILSGKMPTEEIVYYNNDKFERTVQNSNPVKGTVRPRFDLEAEISTNGDYEEKKKLMTLEAKDQAYVDMMNNSKYTYSKYPIGTYYNLLATAFPSGSNGFSIKYIPSSLFVDGSTRIYTYIIGANSYIYNNKISDYVTVLAKSKNYFVLDGSGATFTFLIKKDYATYVKSTEVDSVGSFVDNPNFEYIEKTPDSSGKLVSYDTSMQANYFFSGTASVRDYEKSFQIMDSLQQLLNSSYGIMITDKTTRSDGTVEYLYGSYTGDPVASFADIDFYIVDSNTPLSYADLINKIKSDSLVHVYNYASKKSYYKDMSDHSESASNNIKMYIFGKETSLSLVGMFKPDHSEEGKEAYIFNFILQDIQQ